MKVVKKSKIGFILFIISLSFVSLKAIAFTDCNTKLSSEEVHENGVLISNKLPSPRALVPPSLAEHIVTEESGFKTKIKGNLECNTSMLCASFDINTTENKVSAWMGFNFENITGSYFLATYGQEASYLGDNTYATKKWDKGHFWINIGEDTVPFPIQPRFVGIDKESSNEWYVVDYLGFQKADINYTTYTDNLSLSSLILLINPSTKKVEQYYLEYYDENDEYSGDYNIQIGDKVQATFLAFKEGEKDKDYLVSIEGITAVTSPITFEYKEQYPGIDFNCTYCGDLDFSQIELNYIFEEFSEKRSTFTEPQLVETKETNVGTSSKSVLISGFWIFFILSIFVTMVVLKNDNKSFKV